jgi:hypothetical protein
MNRLSNEDRGKVINCLIEGCSIRATVRMTGIAKKTESIMRLLRPQLFQLIKIHRTLRTSPAMAAGVTTKLWSVKDLVTLWESFEQSRKEAA